MNQRIFGYLKNTEKPYCLVLFSMSITMKYLVTSDIHLGHLKTPTEHIINSFKKVILNEKNKDIDVLFIAGDLFDRLLDLNSKEVHVIIEFFNYLLNYCYQNDIAIRVLEGTPSHDWQQSHILLKLNNIREKPCDFKYFKTLDIEYLEKIGKYVLYIPDEWCNNHLELEKQIEEKLSLFNIHQVDIAILHGQFTYQTLGKYKPDFCFQENYFLNLVKGFIHIGHYHSFSTYDRIIANGSLERLAHGEEEPKGFVIVKGNTYTFVENTYSYTYKTILITRNMTLEALDKKIYQYPKQSYIRLVIPSNHDFNLHFKELKLRYYDYHIKRVTKDEMEKDTRTYIKLDDTIELSMLDFTESNIYEILLNNLMSKHEYNSVQLGKIKGYISIFKEEENGGAL